MAEYTPSTNLTFAGGSYTPASDLDFGSATGATEITTALGAVVQATVVRQAGLAAALVQERSAEIGLNTALNPPALNAGVDAVTVRSYLVDAALGALLQQERGQSVGLDAAIALLSERWASTELGAVVSALRARFSELGTVVQGQQTLATGLDAATGGDRKTCSALLDAALMAIAARQRTTALGSVVQQLRRFAAYPDCAPFLGINAEMRTRRVRLDMNLLPGVDMALSFSTGLRNHLLGRYAHETGDGLGGAMHNCYIDIYSGEKPASPDFPPVPGTYLGTVSQGGYPGPDWGGSWREPEAGAIEKSRTEPWVMYGVREGVAGWFRMRLIDDLNEYSTTAHRIDGTIVEDAGDGDLVMPNRTVSVGSRHDIHQFKMVMRQDN